MKKHSKKTVVVKGLIFFLLYFLVLQGCSNSNPADSNPLNTQDIKSTGLHVEDCSGGEVTQTIYAGVGGTLSHSGNSLVLPANALPATETITMTTVCYGDHPEVEFSTNTVLNENASLTLSWDGFTLDGDPEDLNVYSSDDGLSWTLVPNPTINVAEKTITVPIGKISTVVKWRPLTVNN